MAIAKICPLLAQGWIIAHYKKSTCSQSTMEMEINSIINQQAPKCLKEGCALWIPETFTGRLKGEAHCGLQN